MQIEQLKNLESSGQLLIDLGQQPISNRFQPAGTLAPVPSFPMQLRIDMDTGLIHQGTPFPVEELKPRYDWLTCFEPEDHLDELANKLTKLTNVTQSSTFGAYSFKDDSTLRRLERLGYSKTWRIEPVMDLGILDTYANVETYQQALTLDKALAIRDKRGAADVLIVRHVVEHAYGLARIHCGNQRNGKFRWLHCLGTPRLRKCAGHRGLHNHLGRALVLFH